MIYKDFWANILLRARIRGSKLDGLEVIMKKTTRGSPSCRGKCIWWRKSIPWRSCKISNNWPRMSRKSWMVIKMNFKLWTGNGGFTNVRWVNSNTRNLKGLGSDILIHRGTRTRTNGGKVFVGQKGAVATMTAAAVRDRWTIRDHQKGIIARRNAPAVPEDEVFGRFPKVHRHLHRLLDVSIHVYVSVITSLISGTNGQSHWSSN